MSSTEKLYDLSATDDTSAWNTHEIRSHRAPRRHVSRRFIVAVAAVMAVTTVLPLEGSVGVPPVSSEAPVAAQAVVVSPIPERVISVSRNLTRKTAAPTRTKRITKVINYAMAQRGDRYRYGAAGPSKWDCSGLVMMSYRQIGIKLPHYTGGIQKKGTKVSKKNLKRGDIIFPQRGHVGIYLGNGKMVAASSGKGKVVVQKVYGFYTARRMI